PDAKDEEKPQHRVRISRPFSMGATEVTVGQFRRFVERTHYRTSGETSGKAVGGWNGEGGSFLKAPKYNWRDPGFTRTDEDPVVDVTWNDAVVFCSNLSKSPGVDPLFPASVDSPVARGGSWFAPPERARSAARGGVPGSLVASGFRVVRVLTAQ